MPMVNKLKMGLIIKKYIEGKVPFLESVNENWDGLVDEQIQVL